jgi:hypothetical protein
MTELGTIVMIDGQVYKVSDFNGRSSFKLSDWTGDNAVTTTELKGKTPLMSEKEYYNEADRRSAVNERETVEKDETAYKIIEKYNNTEDDNKGKTMHKIEGGKEYSYETRSTPVPDEQMIIDGKTYYKIYGTWYGKKTVG